MKKKILIGFSALLVLVIILSLLQMLVVPKNSVNLEGRLTGEYYDNVGGHDVLFVGDCEIYESFIPSVLWEKHGITSYVRGNPQQLAWHSYYLLEETFEYEKPKIVVFNVFALKYGEPQSEEKNRMVFDTMKWSPSKINAINASMTEDESFFDYVFPLLRYHSRITELEDEDFNYWFSSPENGTDNGYVVNTRISPMKEYSSEIAPPEEGLPDSALQYLDKMKALCDENGAKLVLVKVPTNVVPNEDADFWWHDEWDAQIDAYAKKLGVSYKNFIPDAQKIGIDWNTDTHDGGYHLNTYGAEKMTDYFGKILVEEFGLKSQKDNAEVSKKWNEYLIKYNELKKESEDSNR